MEELFKNLLFSEGDYEDMARLTCTYEYKYLSRMNILYALSMVSGMGCKCDLSDGRDVMKKVLKKVLGDVGYVHIDTDGVLDEMRKFSSDKISAIFNLKDKPDGLREYLSELGVSYEGYIEFVRRHSFKNLPEDLIYELVGNPYINSLMDITVYKGYSCLFAVEELNYLSEGFDCPLVDTYYDDGFTYLVFFNYDVSTSHYEMSSDILQWLNIDGLLRCVS